MGQRSRVVVGSIVGAVAVHLAMLACSGDGGSPPGQLDASAVDGGHQARADAGDILDAITAGDLGGALDAVADVVRDAVGKAVDAETRDAHAGGDGGAGGECACIRRAESTFSFSVDRGRGAEIPVARFSTAALGVTARPGPSGLDGPAAYDINGSATAYLRDGTRVFVNCSVAVTRDRQRVVLSDAGPAPAACSIGLAGSASFNAQESTNAGVEVVTLENDRVELRVAQITSTNRDAAVVRMANLVIRTSVAGGQLLAEFPGAYRP